MAEFCVGQLVRCIEPSTISYRLIAGRSYEVLRVRGSMVTVNDERGQGAWRSARFVSDTPLTPFELDVKAYIDSEMEALRG